MATKIWGDYRYLPAQYVRWLESWDTPPVWAAMMDYCCEEEITGDNDGVIKERQVYTTEYARYFIQQYGYVPWAWVPTVQGWDVASYARHARQLQPLVRQLQSFYTDRPGLLYDAYEGEDEPEGMAQALANATDFRVGIGTLCRRASVSDIAAIVAAVAEELPGVPLHLWGVKLGALGRALPSQVASVDSAAWNQRFGTYLERQKTSGMTQREFSYKVSLPDYLSKVNRALARAV